MKPIKSGVKILVFLGLRYCLKAGGFFLLLTLKCVQQTFMIEVPVRSGLISEGGLVCCYPNFSFYYCFL